MNETINRKRLLFKEDIDFDVNGSNDKVTIEGKNGTSFVATKLNASHIPLTKRIRALLNARNVEDAIYALINGNGLYSGGEINPSNLPIATEISNGVARLATKTEVLNGSSDDTIVSPRKLHDLKASTTQLGLVEIANNDDLTNGTRPNSVVSIGGLMSLGLSSLPIGVGPIPWYWGEPPDGWVVANGGLYSRSVYPKFWELIKNFTVTDSVWQENTASFSSGDGGSTFRMPNLTVLNMGGGDGLKPNLINVVYIFKGK